MQLYEKLKNLEKRRYEHKHSIHPTAEFINLIQQASKQVPVDETLSQLFPKAEIVNVRRFDKKPASIQISIARNNGNIFVNSARKPYIEAYINPITELVVCEDEVRHDLDFNGLRDNITFTPHHQFQILAQAFAASVVSSYIQDLESLDSNELAAKDLKPINQITMELNQYIENGQDLYANIAKELSFLHTPSLPSTNQFMAFADDVRPKHYVTGRTPYPNPINYLDMDTRLVNRFLDVFFEETDKLRFSWYMGAALRNKRIDDITASKMLMMSSAFAGSGKSTLVLALTKALFGKEFGNISGDFDAHFRRDNRFVTEQIVNARMNVYLEAEFGLPTKDGNMHDFNGLDVSTIKTMITDGFMATEEKYQNRKSNHAAGFHLVLTNHPARITEETSALSRRILPCLVKSNSMEDKAKQLGLFGQKNFEKWVMDHALEFAVYFVRCHIEHEYDYMNYRYNSKAFIQELNHYRRGSMMDLDPLSLMNKNKDNLFSMLNIMSEVVDFNLEAFIEEIQNTPRGINYGDIRISDGIAYVNASVKFWGKFSNAPDTVRDIIIEVYGAPEKKYQQNRFTLPCVYTDLDDFRQVQSDIQSRDEEVEIETKVVDEAGHTIELDDLSDAIKSQLKTKADETVAQLNQAESTPVQPPQWMKYVDQSKLVNVMSNAPVSESGSSLVFDNERMCFRVTPVDAPKDAPKAVKVETQSPYSQLSHDELVGLVGQLVDYQSKVDDLVRNFATDD